MLVKDAASAHVCMTAPTHKSGVGLWCKVG